MFDTEVKLYISYWLVEESHDGGERLPRREHGRRGPA